MYNISKIQMVLSLCLMVRSLFERALIRLLDTLCWPQGVHPYRQQLETIHHRQTHLKIRPHYLKAGLSKNQSECVICPVFLISS